MKRKIEISVVVPAFNEENFLPNCLKNLKEQSFQNFEIIVVDNNSSDKTAQVAKSFGAKVVKEENQGVAFARQRGLLEAKGEIVVFTDADTILPQNWLSRIFSEFEKDKELIAFGGSCELYSGPFYLKILTKLFLKPFLELDRFFSGGWNLMGCNMAVKKEALLKIGGFNTKLKMNEDIEISFRLRKIGKIKFDPDFRVKVSGRRFSYGMIFGLFHYLPTTISRWLFRKFDRFQFFPPHRKEEYSMAYFIFFHFILVFFFVCFLFSAPKAIFVKNSVKNQTRKILAIESTLKNRAGVELSKLKLKIKHEKGFPHL